MPSIDELYQQGELTEEQYQAVIDENEEVLCLACAGSGKSRTIAYRIARLIQQDNPPNSIIAFTFTDKAAESLKRRVAGALIKSGLPVQMVGAMYIGTIHSYCQHLLSEMNARYNQYDVLDDNGLKLYLLTRYFDLSLNRLQHSRNSRMFATINEVANAWKLANDEMLSIQDIRDQDEILGEILDNLNQGLRTDQYLDFSLMIRLVVEALESNNGEINGALLQNEHLLVDEYQDVNPSQERLIAGLDERLTTLFVVGDDDQSIYGWRGADVQNIIEFNQRRPETSIHTLSTNFRSTETIVNASDYFIQSELSTGRINKEPISFSDGNSSQFLNLWFESKHEEANWIALKISELIGLNYQETNGHNRGLTYSDIAILMRSVQGGTRNGNDPHHRMYTNALTENGINYLIESEGSIFERDHARIVRDSMELLRNPAINRDNATEFFHDQIAPVFPNGNLNEFLQILANWNTQIHRAVGGARRKVYPQLLVHELISAFRVSQTQFENHEQVFRDLGVFSSIVLDVEKVFVSIDSRSRFQSMLNFLSNIAESGYDSSQVELMNRPNAVTVSTIHKMKGLEYPVVFMVDVVNQRFPSRRSSYNGWIPENLLTDTLARGLYQTNHEGESRLFYTALTRAERFLYITGGANHPNLRRPKDPSSFKLRISEIEDENISDNPDQAIENRTDLPEQPRIEDDTMPTSFTEVKDYLECPMKYKFRKVYGFSPAVPELFGFGLTTHTSIARIHQLFPEEAPSIQEAEEIIDDTFHLKHVFPSNDPERPGPYERARDASKRIIGNYINNYEEDFTQNRTLEQRFEIQSDQALITGAIDLLLKEDNQGQILEAKVIDFKSMGFPDEQDPQFWINLSLQVQLYAHASTVVLGENARTGAVHLLKAEAGRDRIEIPITEDAINNALDNINWAVTNILRNDFPMRPSDSKCANCDFSQICAKQHQGFVVDNQPSQIILPTISGQESIMVGAFSNIDDH